ncbi:uncharacterized protein LOC134247430 [Saccostrea cucullata]|uniref:uncharacterized protein LOC134247430 n=1 Tax=Saccostrea cuccullata TaxID=36930 RepID=UPI002ED302BD
MAGEINLDFIPSDISLDYFKNIVLSKRSKERGYNFFINGYINALKLFKSNDTSVDISAKCFRSMRKSEAPHKINMTITTSAITESLCTCKAGISGTCSRAVGVLYTIVHYKNMGLTEVPSALACTSLPQQWHKPRGPKILPEPVSAMVFAKPKQTPRKKRPVHSTMPKMSIPSIDFKEIKKLKTDPSAEGTPLSYLLQEELHLTQTPLGDVQQGSMLPYQLKNYKTIPSIENGTCGNTVFPLDSEVPFEINTKFKELNQLYNTTQEEAVRIERSTVHQSKNEVWFADRKTRVTASQFHKICKRKKDITDSFVCNIFNQKSFSSEATSYGKCHENVAKQKLMERHQNIHIHDCGLVINPLFSFLAATPDGKICLDGQTGVLEIKCPFSVRNLLISEAVQLPNFCLQASGDSYQLKKNHDYFFQIQGQLMVTGTSFCIFVVYTKKDLFIEKIPRDPSFMKEMFDKLANFFLEHALSKVDCASA